MINRVINLIFKFGIKIPYRHTSVFNNKVIQTVIKGTFDLVWIDKGMGIKAKTLKRIKEFNPNIKIVGYSPDEMTQKHNQSYDFIHSLPYYDAYVTTKSYAVNDLKKLGANKVLFVNNAFQDDFHYPREITVKEQDVLGGDIGFIGSWEEDRARIILYLAKNGLKVRVWGTGSWIQYKDKFPNLTIEGKGLYSEDYCKALKAFKINLCFLRKMNLDLQTTRTMEIPACGGFMLAERTNEHLALFEEDKEASFFSSPAELLEKCKFYLENEETRKMIAENGYQRCKSSGYSNIETIKSVIQLVMCEK
ncbi:glycosyltransferase [Flavobacterium sp. NG2]|uniref:CgeB family protein n=1 Tax=Flavobacterium sp. NG2 TaxID=3097547 RepID=UPI002A83AFDE|nr:glycosyltransferase [Flavobacterium sp. NG2]WPR71648.1 glycosyltransferase [Flavobacterium sp. NG2]